MEKEKSVTDIAVKDNMTTKSVGGLQTIHDPQEGTSWSDGVMEREPSTSIKKRKTDESDSPLDRSKASLFKHFTEIGNQFCVNRRNNRRKRKEKNDCGDFCRAPTIKGKI